MSDSNFRHLKADTIRGQATVKNYIKNAFASENVNQWATYSNTAQSTPVTGSGSSGGSQTVAQVTSNNTTVNSINTNQWPAQSFTTTTSTTVLSASLKLDQVGGTGATGSMFVAIYTVSGGNPGTLLGTSNAVNANTLTSTPTDTVFTFSSGPALSASTQYYMVLQPTGVTFNSSVIEIARDNTNPYAGGNANLSLDGGSTWNPVAGSDLTFNVIGTGGINVTLTRNTSSPLRNEADFLFTKDAANRQGQGVSYDFTIDKADINKQLSISFDYLGSAAFVTGANSDIQVFIYDITNASLIPLSNQALLITQGFFAAKFQASSSQSYRLIFHIATTNASAYTLEYTNVEVNTIQTLPQGPIVTDWQSYTLNINGSVSNPTLGTVIENSAFYRRVGDSAQITFAFRNTSAGTAGSGTYLFTLPPGLTFDINKLNNTEGGSGPYNLGPAQPEFTVGGIVAPSQTSDDATHSSLNIFDFSGNAVSSANYPLSTPNTYYGFNATIPISQWTSSVASTSSSNLIMSQILANGTRVTGVDPAAIGEYRTQLRQASTTNFTDVNGAPSIATTGADGMAIWAGNGFTASDSNNSPSQWTIFVGRNKTVKVKMYNATGKSDPIDYDVFLLATATISGEYVFYDQNTGLLTVNHPTNGVDTTGYLGRTSTFGNPNQGYFDVIVSDNEFQIQLQGKPYYSGYHTVSGGGSEWHTNSGSFADPVTAGTVALSQRLSNSLIVTTAGSSLPGITFSPNSAGSVYKITAHSTMGCVTSNTVVQAQMTDGNNNPICNAAGLVLTAGAGSGNLYQGVSLSALFAPGSTSPATVKLQIRTNSGTAQIGTIFGSENAIEWIVEQIA